MTAGAVFAAGAAALFALPFWLLLGWLARRRERSARTHVQDRGSQLADEFARREREFEESLRRQQQERTP